MTNWVAPDWFIQHNKNAYGHEATEFIERLPGILSHLSARWKISIGDPFDTIFRNFAAPALRSDGVDLVIKISADKESVERQTDSLRLFDGNGTVRLFEASPGLGAMLIERAIPGHRLTAEFDEESSAFIQLFRHLWRIGPCRPGTAIPTLTDLGRSWISAEIGELRGLLRDHDLFGQISVADRAEAMLGSLLSSRKEEILLHADMNAGNVLSASRLPLLAIDPSGLMGERAYDASLLFRDDSENLLARDEPEKLLSRRLARLANELDLDIDRLRSWSFIQSVIGRLWQFKMGLPTRNWSLTTKFLQDA